MTDKKDPGKFTIRFNTCDPQHTHNQTEYYILTDDGVTKAGWQDGMLSYVISGQISEAEIKEMINSIQ